MKNYNNNNYSRYKSDVKSSQPEGKFWDEYTRDELIINFMPLVENLASKFSTSDSASGVMSINDLIQQGNIGLTLAVDRIDWDTISKSSDPEKTLKSFLAKRIKGAIRRGNDINRGSMRIPEHKLNELRKSNTEESAAMFFNSMFASIDASNDQNFIYDIPDEDSEPNNEVLNTYLMQILKEHLNTREYDVVRMSFGLDCDKKSASEIAEYLGIKGSSSYVRVSQLKKQAIDTLRNKVDRSQVADLL